MLFVVKIFGVEFVLLCALFSVNFVIGWSQQVQGVSGGVSIFGNCVFDMPMSSKSQNDVGGNGPDKNFDDRIPVWNGDPRRWEEFLEEFKWWAEGENLKVSWKLSESSLSGLSVLHSNSCSRWK